MRPVPSSPPRQDEHHRALEDPVLRQPVPLVPRDGPPLLWWWCEVHGGVRPRRLHECLHEAAVVHAVLPRAAVRCHYAADVLPGGRDVEIAHRLLQLRRVHVPIGRMVKEAEGFAHRLGLARELLAQCPRHQGHASLGGAGALPAGSGSVGPCAPALASSDRSIPSTPRAAAGRGEGAGGLASAAPGGGPGAFRAAAGRGEGAASLATTAPPGGGRRSLPPCSRCSDRALPHVSPPLPPWPRAARERAGRRWAQDSLPVGAVGEGLDELGEIQAPVAVCIRRRKHLVHHGPVLGPRQPQPLHHGAEVGGADAPLARTVEEVVSVAPMVVAEVAVQGHNKGLPERCRLRRHAGNRPPHGPLGARRAPARLGHYQHGPTS
mmetsp:Transcript_50644/g.162090  ORF Transcript_50644/g.162090 Transcript_50644/m.162090 type:complete len:378 (-) Transcript_50644:400-1533(-)